MVKQHEQMAYLNPSIPRFASPGNGFRQRNRQGAFNTIPTASDLGAFRMTRISRQVSRSE